MSEKPILFNGEMVNAILDGRKTATRRVIKKERVDKVLNSPARRDHPELDDAHVINRLLLPPYEPGDILYVRETWQYGGPLDDNDQVIEPLQYYYAADGDPFERWLNDDGSFHEGMKWRPSVHMPKEAARIWLRVTDVRAEKLRNITEEGAVKEGLYKGWRLHGRGSMAHTARQAFMWLWETITRRAPAWQSWACDPWVWVIEFERIDIPMGWCAK